MEILELQLFTDNLEETEKFYRNILEFPILEKSQTRIIFKAGSTRLIFSQSKDLHPYYHVAFNIPVNKLEEALSWIETKKIEIIPITPVSKIADFASWSARSVYFYDNNKNILEFITRTDLKIISKETFNASSIISVSEIGIVTTNVLEESKRVLKEYNIPVFTKWKSSEHFIAQGDDNGLLIIVEKDRNWYPTNVAAKQFPGGVKIKQGSEIYQIIIP